MMALGQRGDGKSLSETRIKEEYKLPYECLSLFRPRDANQSRTKFIAARTTCFAVSCRSFLDHSLTAHFSRALTHPFGNYVDLHNPFWLSFTKPLDPVHKTVSHASLSAASVQIESIEIGQLWRHGNSSRDGGS